MDQKRPPSPSANDTLISFRPVSEGLGFHPFSDGLPYAPMGKNPKPVSTGGAGAVAAGPPRIALNPPMLKSPKPMSTSGAGAVAAGPPRIALKAPMISVPVVKKEGTVLAAPPIQATQKI